MQNAARRDDAWPNAFKAYFRQFTSGAFALVFVMLLAACASTTGGQAVMGAPDTTPVILRVGAETFTEADFVQRLSDDIAAGIADLLAQGQTREQIEQLANDSNVRGSVLDRMVQDALLIDYARRNGIGVDPAAVDAAVPAPAPPDPSVPVDPAAQPTPTSAEQRAQLARDQLVFEVIARNTRADMVRARHVLVADEAAADAILAELAAGADFAAIARERSTDTSSAAEGGDLGWTPRGDYVAEFEEVAFSAPLNAPAKVQSQFGWHVLEVLERQEGRPFDSFDRLRQSSNAQSFYEQSFVPWYDELRAQAELSGDLELAPGFDPNNVPLPFPEGTP
jgi:peptidyl-prolyl cis-trans isomerase C